MSGQPDAAKRHAVQAGLDAEHLVANMLEGKGFLLLKHRYKTPYGEIDLIMRHGDLVVFIEVKKRPSFNEGLLSVSRKSQRRISDAASLFIADHANDLSTVHSYRFDVAVVTADLGIHLLENAFQSEG